MNGKIYFHSLESLAEFLKLFGSVTDPEGSGSPVRPSSAVFECRKELGYWVVSFNGAY